jgi:hypothetical protein
VAADGAGVDHRRHDRGGRSRFRRDHSRRGKHPHPDSLPGGTDLLSGIHVGRTWRCSGRVWLRVLLPGCLPERVLLSERSAVIVPGRISAGEHACIRACLSARVRVPEPPLVPLSGSDLGTAYVQGPDANADADHSTPDERAPDFGTSNFGAPNFGAPDFGAPDFGTSNFGTSNFGTGRIHAGEHTIIRSGARVWVAAQVRKASTSRWVQGGDNGRMG